MSPFSFYSLRRRTLQLGMLLTVLAAATARAEEPQAIIKLRTEAWVTSTDVLLGDVADIEAPMEVRARVQSVSLSSSPLPDRTRSIEAGYIKLRLRRFGIDPAQASVLGEAVVVHRVGTTQPSPLQELSASTAAAPPSEPAAVRQGQLVDVEVRCGGVTVRTSGVAGRDGATGDLIDLRLEKLSRKLPARIVGPGRVVLTINERML